MNLDEMLNALEAEAKENGDIILAEAKAQANEILSEAKAKGEKLAANSFDRAVQRAKLERAKILSAAQFDVKKEVLIAKEKVVEELFTKVEAEAKQEFENNESLLKILADEAISKFEGQKVKVYVNNTSKDLAEKVLNGQQIEGTLNTIGGLKVTSENGRISVDNTVEGRLRKIRQVFEPEIIKTLFGGEE